MPPVTQTTLTGNTGCISGSHLKAKSVPSVGTLPHSNLSGLYCESAWLCWCLQVSTWLGALSNCPRWITLQRSGLWSHFAGFV